MTSAHLQSLRTVQQLENEKKAAEEKLAKQKQSGQYGIAEMDVSELEKQIIALYREKDSLTTQGKAIMQQIMDKEKYRNETKQLIDTLCAQNDDIQERIIVLSTERTTHEQKMDLLTKELAQLEVDLVKLREQTKTLQTTIDANSRRVAESAAFIKKSEEQSSHRPLKRFLLKISSHHGGSSKGAKPIRGVTFMPHLHGFMTIGDDKTMIHHSLPDLNESTPVPTNGIPNNLRIHGEFNRCSLSCADNYVRVIDLSTSRIISELRSHNDQVTDTQWISKFQLLSSSKDRTMKIFDLNRNQVCNTISIFSAVNTIGCTNDPATFVAGCSDGSIKFIDTRKKGIIQKIDKVHSKACTCLVTSPMRDMIYSIGLDNTICVTSIMQGSRMMQITHPKLQVKNEYTKISISPDGGFLCAGSKTGDVILFDLFSATPGSNPIVLPQQHKAPVISSAFASNLLITCDEANTICMWK